MALAGIAAAYASHSDAILVDGLYSGVNFVSAIIAAQVSQSLLKPADRRYPFGYDAYEALYVKYRTLVLMGIMAFAAIGAISKIVRYLTGGEVPELVFGPILIYMIAMITTCFSLAAWHHYNWKKTGGHSGLLRTESKASVVDGVISAGAGGGLLAALFLRGTALEPIVPISDSIIVLIMCTLIAAEPVRMFLHSLREVAGGGAEPEVVDKVLAKTRDLLHDRPLEVLEVAVTQMGRTHFVVPYIKPKQGITAAQVDTLRSELETVYSELLGHSKTEILITAENPYSHSQSINHA